MTYGCLRFVNNRKYPLYACRYKGEATNRKSLVTIQNVWFLSVIQAKLQNEVNMSTVSLFEIARVKISYMVHQYRDEWTRVYVHLMIGDDYKIIRVLKWKLPSYLGVKLIKTNQYLFVSLISPHFGLRDIRLVLLYVSYTGWIMKALLKIPVPLKS